jgi:type I restriction-modification system DNA methylase subunit
VQGKFFASVFEKVLGYSTFLDGGEFNLIQEHKTVLDSTESDGALGFFTSDNKMNVRAVIELKDAKTDLDKKQNRSNHLTPVEQAFNYAHKHGSGCGWVIVSNFVEIRLYKSSSSLEYEKFLMTDMDKEAEFKRFYFLLCKENLIESTGKSLVDKLYDDNEHAQDEISNEFYNDYKKLRADLYGAMKANNSGIDEMVLFSKAQKVLDRFIFVCFCENRGLLPQGIFQRVIEAAKSSFEMLPNQLWKQLKGLFQAIDKGNPPMRINAYNGGLFKKDDVLDSLTIPDEELERFTKLSGYDFDSELNVNILGNIFEQSIADLELIKAEIAGIPIERQSKRKDDGIFYTPPYVTKFIVTKTIGRWLEDEKVKIKRDLVGTDGFIATVGDYGKRKGRKVVVKKWEEIPDESDDKNNREAIVELHKAFWEVYTEKLRSIRVLDPACGSGAFLNEAFDFLVAEGNYATEMHNSLEQGQMSLFDWDIEILKNNLYGVDLNVESVEITKLSLWLKTAREDRELTALDENIKCGNSIIACPEIAGELAFDWGAEFPAIMEQGGFDVVIGNPPYGATLSQTEKDYITANYATTEYNFDTYKTFMELGLKLTKHGGYMGYITPNTYFILEKGANKLRKFLFENYTLLDIAELFNVFPTAVVEPTISVFKNEQPINNRELEVISVPRKTDLASTFISDGVKTIFKQSNLLEKENYIFNYKETGIEKSLRQKIDSVSIPLIDYFNVSPGIKPYAIGEGSPPQSKEITVERIFDGFTKVDDTWLPYVRGKNIEKYTDAWSGEYIKYGEWLARPRKSEVFKGEKLFIRQTGDYPIATLDTDGKVSNATAHCIYKCANKTHVLLKYALGIINSQLLRWIYEHDNFHMVGKPLAQVKLIYVERLPIVVANDQSVVISYVDRLLEKCQERFDKAKQFTDYLSAMYSPKSISEKLSEFYKLDFKGFVDELKKQKVKLNATQEMGLMPLFAKKSGELVQLSREIERLDNELDEVVFGLYGLTAEERAIVLGS